MERNHFLNELLENVDNMLVEIETREVLEPDFAIVRELAEQLREELHALTE